MLQIKLTPLDQRAVRGIYTINGEKGKMPRSACYLEPEAARSFVAFLQEFVVVSDILRTPESSLRAVQAGRGAKAPGYSGHNFGLSIDIDIKATMKNFGLKTKLELDDRMAGAGWYCHRTDHKPDFEAWHYNFLEAGITAKGLKSTAGLLENRIKTLYPVVDRSLSNSDAQRLLVRLGLYGGDFDGIIGPRSRDAIRLFQKTWGLPQTGKLDSKTNRTLLFVTRKVEIV